VNFVFSLSPILLFDLVRVAVTIRQRDRFCRRRASFHPPRVIEVAAVGVSMNPDGVHTRPLQERDFSAVLHWRDLASCANQWRSPSRCNIVPRRTGERERAFSCLILSSRGHYQAARSFLSTTSLISPIPSSTSISRQCAFADTCQPIGRCRGSLHRRSRESRAFSLLVLRRGEAHGLQLA
jgi:hypothetical protein